MLKKLKTHLTFFCGIVIGMILLTMTVFCILISERGIRNKNYANFQNNAENILTFIGSNEVLSHTWLSRVEHNYHMVVDIRDRETPLLYNTLYDHSAISPLLAHVRAIASDTYGMTSDNVISSGLHFPQKTFSFSFQHKEYFAMTAFLPHGEGFLDIAIVTPAITFGAQLLTQRLYFFLGAFFSWLILVVLSYFFICHMLKPIEESRIRQAQFIAAASHELRSPLAVMLSNLSAAKVAAPEAQKTFFSIIESEGNRMSRLITEMLTLTRLDSHALILEAAPCELDTLLLDAFEKFEVPAKAKGIALTVDLPEAPIKPCLCDKEKIDQVLSILIDNALSYTPAGGCVSLSLSVSGKRYLFTVSDNGCGIPDEAKETIFQRFYRLDSSRKDREHFGLGLCIAHEIVTLHHGSITVSDAAGGGSIFTVTLPIASPGAVPLPEHK